MKRGAIVLSVVFVAVVSAAACGRGPDDDALDRLRPCSSSEGPADAYCGTLEVYENRATQAGRRVPLKIVVLPALRHDASPDPLFFLAGGPGQGAAQMAPQVRDAFQRLQRDRDIVLVDQRGTGRSNPLECRGDRDSLEGLTEPDEAALARLRRCLEGFDADVRMYTTTIAMDDLEDVRAHLGYERINLYGGSYGTRAALVYLRRHEGRVRAIVLDGVAPTDMRLPVFTARDAQRALDRVLADCDADPDCRAAYPDLARRVAALLARIDASPERVRLVHPRTGVEEDVEVNARFVASILFGALYSPLTASMLPMLIDRAERHDYQGLVALALAGESAEENLSVGMQLSVICSEDAPRIAAGDRERETARTVFGLHLMAGLVKACEFWPKGSVEAGYYEPVRSDVPALILSGEVDPVTPPSWGDAVAQHLTNARHLTVPATGHGAAGAACVGTLIQTFLERGSADGLDAGCLGAIERPPFFLTPAGPNPAPSRKGA